MLKLIRIVAALLLALGTLVAVPAPAQASISIDQVTAGLSSPVAITHAGDSTNRLFITEQIGRIRIYSGGTLQTTAFLDISSLVLTGGEQGLLSVAFHPNYETNGFLFVYYTNKSGDNVVARYTASPANANTVNTSTGQIVLTIPHPTETNHNGGQLKFGPDGLLYIGTGDGGGAGDPNNNAQNINSPLGKILRLNVNTLPYQIPSDNPFADQPGNPRPGDDRIWAYGLRNPWRFSFDRSTGDMYIGDVGQSNWEEIDFQPAGVGGNNYGWRLMEGNHCFNPATNCNTGGLTLPVIEYANGTQECSVTGGYRYRGPSSGNLDGLYIYGDYCSGKIWGASPDQQWATTLLFDTTLNISSFGEDEAGHILLAHHGGSLYRISTARIVDTSGYVLDGWGGLHRYALGNDSAPIIHNGPYWQGHDLARALALRPRAMGGGYLLDAYGGVHPLGPAQPLHSSAYWSGWDIARDLALNPDGQSGYILDGFGGLHPLGSAGPVTNGPYWNGFDIARAVVLTADSTAANPKGYILDGWGGLHAFGNAPSRSGSAYWRGWDIARGLDLNSGGTGGYVLDGWGGLHSFGAANPTTNHGPYWAGWDIARGVTLLSDGTGGFVLDGQGGLHAFSIGTASALEPPVGTSYFGWDIANGVAGL